jgi:hypothetical protein
MATTWWVAWRIRSDTTTNSRCSSCTGQQWLSSTFNCFTDQLFHNLLVAIDMGKCIEWLTYYE